MSDYYPVYKPKRKKVKFLTTRDYYLQRIICKHNPFYIHVKSNPQAVFGVCCYNRLRGGIDIISVEEDKYENDNIYRGDYVFIYSKYPVEVVQYRC